MEPILVLCGPTASGKSQLAVEVARAFGAEIVGADSRQIYRGMPVGTAAPAPEQLLAVPHHLVDFLDPHERYSAARFTQDAMRAIDDIVARGKRVIVVGGTGFYIRALTGAVSLAPEYDEHLRERLAREARAHDGEFLFTWLRTRDARRATMLHPGDTYRVLRALEVALAPDASRARTAPLRTLASAGYPFVKLALDVPVEELDRRIVVRVDAMLASGLTEEAERIGPDAVAASAVGYPQALGYLRGWLTDREMRASLVRATRQYARRQRSWFRGEPAVRWVTPSELPAEAERLWSSKRS